MDKTPFNYGELGIAAIGLLGVSVLAGLGVTTGQETISVYTLVFGYVFGRSRG